MVLMFVHLLERKLDTQLALEQCGIRGSELRM